MSKYVKSLITDQIRKRLSGVNEALLVDVIGLNSTATVRVRNELAKKNIRLMVVKNSMAARATAGTPLEAAFAGVDGTLAIVWGGEDIVAVAKEIVRLTEIKELAKLQTRGGVLDGTKLSEADAKGVAKWPSRQEQLSILVGQILNPGATLAGQLIGTGGTLAGQIKQRLEDLEKAGGEVAAAPTAEADVPAAPAPEAATPAAAAPEAPAPEAPGAEPPAAG